MRDLFADISNQEQVASYLQHAYETNRVTHAYLLAGGAPNAAFDIAMRFAAALIAQDDDVEYGEALRGAHPDLHVFAPAGTGSYLVEQVRELTHDAELAPMRSSHKIYILKDSHRLSGAPANALLKTLEEPPQNVVCILLANNEAAVLETLRSRCEVLVLHAALQSSAADPRAIDMIDSVAQGCDNRTLLSYAERLVEIAKEKAAQAAEGEEDTEEYIDKYGDYLTQGAKTQIEKQAKRETTARERAVFLEELGSMRLWLRDCLAIQQGAAELLSYPEYVQRSSMLAMRVSVSALLCAIDAIATACSRISYNVTPQLAIEAMFLEIREALCR